MFNLEALDEIMITRPPGRMTFKTACVMKTVPLKLTSKRYEKSSTVASMKGKVKRITPVLFTN